jgi:hypothetical protein
LEWHERDKAWLPEELDKPFDGTTIVMTHHAPASFAISPFFLNDAWNPCFASRLENLLIRYDAAAVWGHTHYSLEMTIANTQFVTNQVGYRNVAHRSASEPGDFGTMIELTRELQKEQKYGRCDKRHG